MKSTVKIPGIITVIIIIIIIIVQYEFLIVNVNIFNHFDYSKDCCFLICEVINYYINSVKSI